MNILIYTDGSKVASNLLKDGLEHIAQVRIFQPNTLEEFKCMLANCYSGETLVVFFATDTDALTSLKKMVKYSVDIKIIIHLLAPSAEIYARALKLHPRFITQAPNEISILPDIVQRIVKEKVKRDELVYKNTEMQTRYNDSSISR